MSNEALWLRASAREVTRCEGHFPISWLTCNEAEPAILIRVDAVEKASFDESQCARFLKEISKTAIYFLTLRHPQRLHQGTYGPPINSFACSVDLVRNYVEYGTKREDAIPYVDLVYPGSLDVDCYQLTKFLLDIARPTPSIRCIQLPISTTPSKPASHSSSVEWITRFDGSAPDLNEHLSGLKAIAPNDWISIGFDDDAPPAQYLAAEEQCNDLHLWRVPVNHGPFFMHDKLAHSSKTEFLIPHESGSISCEDRRNTLVSHLQERDLDIASCHEISVDDGARQVQAIRCALSLDIRMHALKPFSFRLLGSAIRRSAVSAAGGFSCKRSEADQVGLLYRAVLKGLRIGGVDEFLVVRRRAKETDKFGTTPPGQVSDRKYLMQECATDFERCRHGSLRPEDTVFAARHITDNEPPLEPIPPR